jgi:hypothetical protein
VSQGDAASLPNRLTKQQFDHGIRALIPRTILTAEDRRLLTALLNGLFSMYDRNDKQSVNAAELVSGMAVLCAGTKSEKLSESFLTLFDTDGDGLVSRREMWCFIRSFLTALFALSRWVVVASGFCPPPPPRALP